MFEVNTPPVEYRDPWTVPLAERMRRLSRRDMKVAYLYEKADSSTFRYRAYNMVQALAGHADIAAEYFFLDECNSLLAFASKIDILVLCRVRYSHRVNELICHVKSRGGSVIFDCDDLVFNDSFAHFIADTLNQDLEHPGVWDHWYAYTGRLGATLRLCDRAIVTNEFLARKLREYHPVATSIVPNFLNFEQMQVSSAIREEKVASGFKSNAALHIGYFSGTPSHEKDYAVAEGAIERIMRAHPEVHLLVVGYLADRVFYKQFGDRVQVFGLHDFVNLQRVMSLVEINIVPLQQNEFTNCKSELKYFEAAVVGTLTLATPIFSYAGAIADGQNGWLAKSYEWDEKLEQAISARRDYPEHAELAARQSLSRYSPAGQVPAIASALGL